MYRLINKLRLEICWNLQVFRLDIYWLWVVHLIKLIGVPNQLRLFVVLSPHEIEVKVVKLLPILKGQVDVRDFLDF